MLVAGGDRDSAGDSAITMGPPSGKDAECRSAQSTKRKRAWRIDEEDQRLQTDVNQITDNRRA